MTHKFDEAVAAMMSVMGDYLPNFNPQLPKHSISVASLKERSVGLGSRRGTEFAGSLAVTELMAVRVDALVRFLLWATDSNKAGTQTSALTTRLVADMDELYKKGVLRLDVESVSPAHHLSSAPGWRSRLDCRILFEYTFVDPDGAGSLIGRIPVTSDVEERDSAARETTVVTDEMVRWDGLGSPALTVAGPFAVSALNMFVALPGPPPTEAVHVTRTFVGATGPPAPFFSWAAFLDSVSGADAIDRHAVISFQDFGDFEGEFESSGDDVELADIDQDTQPDVYRPLTLDLEVPIVLKGPRDRFEVSYPAGAFPGVCYLRAAGN